ncbi:hypothetical protein WICPIJ_000581 [Wickerhamomyces pijperi]|uniref:Uncharacterized protein n=1 Tax=Wickerhamomyces pijperi TaxID=599730 RepID=A0A9P8QCB3_WICPI|nr:hypothetical protein WICPIJ_000581 [Wickerhamomyces pijperi]
MEGVGVFVPHDVVDSSGLAIHTKTTHEHGESHIGIGFIKVWKFFIIGSNLLKSSQCLTANSNSLTS